MTSTARNCAEKGKSHCPSQPGSSSKVARFPRSTRKKRKTIIHRFVRFVKVWRRLFYLLAVVILIALVLASIIRTAAGHNNEKPAEKEQPQVITTADTQAQELADLFKAQTNGETITINWEALTNAWAAEAGFEKRYTLTDEERLIVCQVVQAEAGGEPFAGKVAVAQCILRACEDDEIRPDVAVRKYGYCKSRPEPTQETLDAVQAVFDFGHVATTEPIKYFYAPDRTTSSWHETQIYVMTINGHKFFKEATE